MEKTQPTINCYLPFQSEEQVALTLENLKREPLVKDISFLNGNIADMSNIKMLVAHARTADYTLLYTKYTTLSLVQFALERMLQIMEDTDAAMVYADHFNVIEKDSEQFETPAPVIDYQQGSLRDDFDFGSVWLLSNRKLSHIFDDAEPQELRYAGLYFMRLQLSRLGKLVHINEYLYYDIEQDTRRSGEKLFDYVNPKNRDVQIEMEQVCTAYLKQIGGYLTPEFQAIDFNSEPFEYDASVIIPCKNRVRTIGDAIRSAIKQKVQDGVKFNIIVVDDNSTDGTVDVIKSFLNDDRVVYIAQDKSWHGIGGNWNAALHHPKCGRFALQLDSDDVYSDEHTVQRFIDAFYQQQCAMVVGTYCITDFSLNTLPPGVIDHREWTADNGRNNALRINGLGAPRGFYTPLVRQLTFPTTKYGEDYAVALRISRNYQIGRIYDVMYYCRRWEDNSDANCDTEAMNRNNLYKDRIRTWELQARIKKNALQPTT